MKKSIAIIIYLLFFNKIAFAKEGMPQLNPEFWLSQILWLTIIFVILYFLIQKFFSPKLFALIDSRTNFIKSLLEEAELCKNQIQKLENEYNLIITEAKNEAKKISIKLKNDFSDKISLKRKEFEKTFPHLEVKVGRILALESQNEVTPPQIAQLVLQAFTEASPEKIPHLKN